MNEDKDEEEEEEGETLPGMYVFIPRRQSVKGAHKGASIYDVRREWRGIKTPQICGQTEHKFKGQGEQVKKSKNYVDVIYESPIIDRRNAIQHASHAAF